ncbi:hypothetical protein ACFX2I_003177 [Malus domestica]
MEETSLVLKTVERANVSEFETGKQDMASVHHLKMMPLSYSVLETERTDMESVQHWKMILLSYNVLVTVEKEMASEQHSKKMLLNYNVLQKQNVHLVLVLKYLH